MCPAPGNMLRRRQLLTAQVVVAIEEEEGMHEVPERQGEPTPLVHPRARKELQPPSLHLQARCLDRAIDLAQRRRPVEYSRVRHSWLVRNKSGTHV